MTGQRARTTAAFTIVEMLVVIGVLGLLLGILLPALSGANRRSLKHKELNSLRQIGLAWTLYANSNNDKILPGFLEVDLQSRWRVSYEYPYHHDVPPAPSYVVTAENPNIAGPWTWRLMPYMDFNHDVVHGYTDEPEFDAITLGTDLAEAEDIAFRPAFGYNAFYVGGWWEMDDDNHARYRFFDATVDGIRRNVVSRSIGTIRRSTELLIFCSASLLEPGIYRSFRNDQPGWHYVVPPRLGTVVKWNSVGAKWTSVGGDSSVATAVSALFQGSRSELEAGGSDPATLIVEDRDAAPIGRYNRLAALLHADGHTATGTPGSLTDMRKWIDAADSGRFFHD